MRAMTQNGLLIKNCLVVTTINWALPPILCMEKLVISIRGSCLLSKSAGQLETRQFPCLFVLLSSMSFVWDGVN